MNATSAERGGWLRLWNHVSPNPDDLLLFAPTYRSDERNMPLEVDLGEEREFAVGEALPCRKEAEVDGLRAQVPGELT